jgi:hypothetical protein
MVSGRVEKVTSSRYTETALDRSHRLRPTSRVTSGSSSSHVGGVPISEMCQAVPTAVTISRILHAGYVFECDGVSIAFDPIFESPFSTNCHAFPPVRFDHGRIGDLHFAAVFISHFHDDHCSLDSLALLPRTTPIRLYCVFPELAEWITALGFVDVRPLDLGAPVTVGPFVV